MCQDEQITEMKRAFISVEDFGTAMSVVVVVVVVFFLPSPFLLLVSFLVHV